MVDYVNAGDSDQLRDLIATVRRYCDATLLGRAEVSFRRSDFNGLAELGLTGMTTPEARGGTALSNLEIAGVIAEIARAELGPAVYLSVHLMVARLISNWSDRFQDLATDLVAGSKLAAFCLTEANAGSDAGALKLRAEKTDTGYQLDGEKIYITSATVADVLLVFGRAEAGITAFIVRADAPGVIVGRAEHKMGCEGAPIASIKFDQCLVGDDAVLGAPGEGFKIALSGLNSGRINIAAAATGLGRRALELAIVHASSRRQFGAAISSFQAMQFMLADMATDLQAATLMTRHAAMELDRGVQAKSAASMAKCFATDAAMRITTDAVQIFGGAGYLREYEVERLMRDAKMLQIVEGTNQIQRLVISREILAR